MLASIGLGTLLAQSEGGLRGALVGTAVAILIARGSALRKGMALLGVSLLAAGAHHLSWRADLALVHLHNAIAILFLLLWRWPISPARVGLCATWALATLSILGGVWDPWVLAAQQRAPSPMLGAVPLMYSLTGLVSPNILGSRLLTTFAFAQAVHYIVWLKLIPELDRDSASPRSFRQSSAALRNELGYGMLALAAAAAFGLLVCGLEDLALARDIYLRGAVWHVYLEVTILGVFFVEGRPRNLRGHGPRALEAIPAASRALTGIDARPRAAKA
jgi:hypothetical protein